MAGNSHTGVLVPDLGKAIAAYSQAFDKEFEEVRTVEFKLTGAVTEVFQLAFAYTLDRTVELVEAVPREAGLFGTAQGFGVHHLGCYATEDLDRVVEAEERTGGTLEYRLDTLEGKPVAVFFAPTPDRPYRLEILTKELRRG